MNPRNDAAKRAYASRNGDVDAYEVYYTYKIVVFKLVRVHKRNVASGAYVFASLR